MIWEPPSQFEIVSPVRIESLARDMQPIRGVRSSLTIRLARGCKRWHPLSPGRRYGARRSPLSEYMSLHLSLKLTTNYVPLSRIKWDTFLWRSVFRFVNWSSFIIFDYVLGWVYDKYTTQSEAHYFNTLYGSGQFFKNILLVLSSSVSNYFKK